MVIRNDPIPRAEARRVMVKEVGVHWREPELRPRLYHLLIIWSSLSKTVSIALMRKVFADARRCKLELPGAVYPDIPP